VLVVVAEEMERLYTGKGRSGECPTLATKPHQSPHHSLSHTVTTFSACHAE